MPKSERQQRLRAIDDLRDMADAMEQAAELFEETMGDLDAVAPTGAKRTGSNRTNEQLQETAKVYGMLLPSQLRIAADAHLGIRGEHDEDVCVVCRGFSGEKGWLTTLIRGIALKEIKRALATNDPEIVAMVTEAFEERVRSDERRRLIEAGRLAGSQ